MLYATIQTTVSPLSAAAVVAAAVTGLLRPPITDRFRPLPSISGLYYEKGEDMMYYYFQVGKLPGIIIP
jgi:hypothetical protein